MKSTALLFFLFCHITVKAQEYDTLQFDTPPYQKGQIHPLPISIFSANKLARLTNYANDSTLNELALFLNENDSIEIYIECYSDNRGSAVMNQIGSMQKAEQIGRYLVEIGLVNPIRIMKMGHGEARPIVASDTIEKYRASDPEKYLQLHLQNVRYHIRISQILPTNTFEQIIDLADQDSIFTSHRSDSSTVFSQYISSACNSDGVVFHLVYQGLNRKLSPSWNNAFGLIESYQLLQLVDNEGQLVESYDYPVELSKDEIKDAKIRSSTDDKEQPLPYNKPHWSLHFNSTDLHPMNSITRKTTGLE